VAVGEVTEREAVLEAIEEFERLGADEFFREHGGGPARTYELVHDGRRYPSKAILAVAYAKQFPDRPPLRETAAYTGGKGSVVPVLERLGFEVEGSRDGRGGEGAAPVHLLLRWTANHEPKTIERHREIAESKGAVWWGKFGDPAARAAVASRKLDHFQQQIKSGAKTYVFLHRPGEVWRASLLAIQYERPDSEANQIPAYYRDEIGGQHLWLKLTDFEQLPSDYAETRLELNDRDPSKTVARALNGQSSLLYVRMSDDDIAVTPPASRRALTAADLQAKAEAAPYNLLLDPGIYATVVAALESGKHIILTGPPGTAKTTLAEAVAETARDLGLSNGYLLTTATADWTTYETIGGLKPKGNNALEFESGHFLRAIEDREWLVIDELNRSQFDRAFGQLFTVLSGQAVSLPYIRPGAEGNLTLVPEGVEPSQKVADVLEIPKDWRIVATMNVFDKSLLFEMSYALMRRFAFIEVPSPSREVFTDLIGRWAEGSTEAASAAEDLLAVREVKDIGPAVYRDIARFARERVGQGSVAPTDLRYQAFYSYLLPQFEGITDEQGERLMRILLRIVGRGKRSLVRETLNGVLGLELPDGGRDVDGSDEPVEPPDED
jgi:MoxR-like ATPase